MMQELTFQGLAGDIDTAVDLPSGTPAGWALLCHPHPLYDGARDNKVITTLSRVCTSLGLIAVRPNFRGVGRSQGVFDNGLGECLDMRLLIQQFAEQFPEAAAGRFVLGGFSFGTGAVAQLYSLLMQEAAGTLTPEEDPQTQAMVERATQTPFTATLPDALMLCGTAMWRFQWRDIHLPEAPLIVHGELDEVVPLNETLEHLRPYGKPMVVLPGTGHFFHGQLVALKRLTTQYLTL